MTDAGIRSLAFDPKGELLATAYDRPRYGLIDPGVEVRSTRTGKVICNFKNPTEYRFSVSFSPDSRKLAANSNSGAIIWDLDSHKLIQRMQGHGDGKALEILFSPKRNQLAIRRETESLTVELWNTETGKLIRVLGGHGGPSESYDRRIAFSPDGTLLAVLCSDKRGRIGDELLRVFDVSTGRERFSLEEPDGFFAVTFSQDGKNIAVSGPAVLKVDVARGAVVAKTDTTASIVRAVGFAADSDRVIMVGSYCVRTWDYAGKRYTDKSVGHERSIKSLAFVPGLPTLVSSAEDYDYPVRLWNLDGGTSSHDAIADYINSVAPSPSGRYIARSCYNRKAKAHFILISDAHNGEEIGRIPYAGMGISLLAWNKQEALLAGIDNQNGTRNQAKLLLWSIPDMKQLVSPVVPGAKDVLIDVCFLPKGKVAAYGYGRKLIHIWDIKYKSCTSLVVGMDGSWVPQLRYSEHSEKLIFNTGEEKVIQIWNPDTGQQEGRILSGRTQWTCSTVPRTTLLASVEWSRSLPYKSTIRFWNVDVGDEVAALPAIDGQVMAIAFDETGTRMALGFANGLIRVVSMKDIQKKAPQKYPSKQLLTESDFWQRASKACGGAVVRDSIGMRVAFAKATLLERFLLIADERLSEAEYYALLRYMVRKEFVAGGRFEITSPFFATELSEDQIRGLQTHTGVPSEYCDGYVEWAKHLNAHPEEIEGRRNEILTKETTLLSESDVFPELSRLRKEGELPQNSLSRLASNRNLFVITKGGGPVRWTNLRQIFGGITQGSGGSAKKSGKPSSPSGQTSTFTITVKVVREKTASYEPVRDLPLSRYIGPFTDRYFTNYKGLVTFRATRGQSIRIWVGGNDSDPISKQIWDGTPKGDMEMEVRIRKSGSVDSPIIR